MRAERRELPAFSSVIMMIVPCAVSLKEDA
jgi:hypothetical protein